MTGRVATGETVNALRAAGCVFAEAEAALLTETAATPADLERMLARRVAGEPLEVILGWAAFCGLRIPVDAGVFVPRRRTEALARQAISLIATVARRPVVVLDLCCGTGAIGAAVLAARPPDFEIELHAADLDEAAVRNARRTLGPAVPVHRGDLYDTLPGDLRGRIDVLVANVPYVPSDRIEGMPPEAREYEPYLALDGGPTGLDVARRLVAGAAPWLAPGGHLLFETAASQLPDAAHLVEAAGLVPSTIEDDDLGTAVVIGRSPGHRDPRDRSA